MRVLFEATEIRTGEKVKGNYIFYKGHNEHFTHAIQVLNENKEVRYVATIDEATLKIIIMENKTVIERLIEDMQELKKTKVYASSFKAIDDCLFLAEYYKKEDFKQETLEEAAEEYEMSMLCTKWQAERMYSEEDLREAFHVGRLYQGREGDTNFEGWFEQFKKKYYE